MKGSRVIDLQSEIGSMGTKVLRPPRGVSDVGMDWDLPTPKEHLTPTFPMLFMRPYLPVANSPLQPVHIFSIFFRIYLHRQR